MLTAALEYARQGIPVFPCVPGKKTPLVAGGFHAATTDPEQIDAWFKGTRNNLAIPTGRVSGRVVVDDDCYAEGGSGLAALEVELRTLLETYTVRTRAGGYQYYFRYPEGHEIRCSANTVARHVDIRGEGGYVVAPPSWVAEDEKGPAGFYTV